MSNTGPPTKFIRIIENCKNFSNLPANFVREDGICVVCDCQISSNGKKKHVSSISHQRRVICVKIGKILESIHVQPSDNYMLEELRSLLQSPNPKSTKYMLSTNKNDWHDILISGQNDLRGKEADDAKEWFLSAVSRIQSVIRIHLRNATSHDLSPDIVRRLKEINTTINQLLQKVECAEEAVDALASGADGSSVALVELERIGDFLVDDGGGFEGGGEGGVEGLFETYFQQPVMLLISGCSFTR
jgi:hypothetical protein